MGGWVAWVWPRVCNLQSTEPAAATTPRRPPPPHTREHRGPSKHAVSPPRHGHRPKHKHTQTHMSACTQSIHSFNASHHPPTQISQHPRGWRRQGTSDFESGQGEPSTTHPPTHPAHPPTPTPQDILETIKTEDHHRTRGELCVPCVVVWMCVCACAS